MGGWIRVTRWESCPQMAWCGKTLSGYFIHVDCASCLRYTLQPGTDMKVSGAAHLHPAHKLPIADELRTACEHPRWRSTSLRLTSVRIWHIANSEFGLLRQVALYVPNLIGYFRLLLLGTTLFTGTESCQVTYWLFVATLLLDGLDGIAARRLNQACRVYTAN